MENEQGLESLLFLNSGAQQSLDDLQRGAISHWWLEGIQLDHAVVDP